MGLVQVHEVGEKTDFHAEQAGKVAFSDKDIDRIQPSHFRV